MRPFFYRDKCVLAIEHISETLSRGQPISQKNK